MRVWSFTSRATKEHVRCNSELIPGCDILCEAASKNVCMLITITVVCNFDPRHACVPNAQKAYIAFHTSCVYSVSATADGSIVAY